MRSSNSLIQELLKRAVRDRLEINSAILPPQIVHVWTMLFFGRDSKVIVHLQKERGFLTLSDYLKKYSDADERMFAPIRPVYLPREALKGWQIMCKRNENHTEEDWARFEDRERQLTNKRFTQRPATPEDDQDDSD